MPAQDPNVRDLEPMVHHRDRMAWPLLALIVAAVLLIVIFSLFPTAPKMAAPAPRAAVPAQQGTGSDRAKPAPATPKRAGRP